MFWRKKRTEQELSPIEISITKGQDQAAIKLMEQPQPAPEPEPEDDEYTGPVWILCNSEGETEIYADKATYHESGAIMFTDGDKLVEIHAPGAWNSVYRKVR